MSPEISNLTILELLKAVPDLLPLISLLKPEDQVFAAQFFEQHVRHVLDIQTTSTQSETLMIASLVVFILGSGFLRIRSVMKRVDGIAQSLPNADPHSATD